MPVAAVHGFSHFQTGVELMKAAMAGGAPRVPVYAQMHEFTAKQLGISGYDFYTKPNIMVPALLEIESEYGLDVASITYDIYNIEAEALGQKLLLTDSSMPDIDRNMPLVRDRADLSLIRTPNFESAGRFAQVIEMFTIFQRLTGIEPTLGFCAPFSLAANLYGVERLLVDIYYDPDFVKAFLDRISEEVLAPWILHQKKHFPNATSIRGADATASLPIVNINILRKWIAPYILRLRELCGPEVCVPNWVGESRLKCPEEMLDLKLAVSPGSILGQDPDVEVLGPDYYKHYTDRHGVSLILGVGAAFLANSSPDEIAERVRYYIEVGNEGGRLALYLCNIGATVPPENVRAAVESAHAY